MTEPQKLVTISGSRGDQHRLVDLSCDETILRSAAACTSCGEPSLKIDGIRRSGLVTSASISCTARRNSVGDGLSALSSSAHRPNKLGRILSLLFLHSIGKLWNCLLPQITAHDSLSNFKKDFKLHMYRYQYNSKGIPHDLLCIQF